MMKPKIEQVDISDLKLTPRNPRKRTPESASVINKSLKEFGACRSIVIDENRIIRAGNGTITEARELGMEDVLIVEATGDQIVAVQRKGLTEEQWEQYTFVDNYASDASSYDIGILREISQEVDLESFCFPGKLEDLFKELEGRTSELAESQETEGGGGGESKTPHEKKEEDQEAVEKLLDNVEEVEPRVKPGEIWALGRHRLGVFDSTVEGNVRALLGDRKADMIFTDPPYLMNFDGGIHADGSKSFNSKHGKIKNDKMSEADGDAFLDKVNKIIKSFCRGAFYITFYRLGIDRYYQSMKRCGLKSRSLIIWHKGNHTLSNSDYMSMYEPIFYGWVEEHNFYGGNNGMDIWEIPRTKKNDLHPTMKPVELVEKAIKDGSKEGDSILDLFLGSGTTIVAAEKMEGGRTVYGMELDPRYAEVTCRRYELLTGDTAKLIGSL